MPVVKKTSRKLTTKIRQPSVLSRIVPVETRTTESIMINVYGRSGTGKTTFACSFPKPLLIVGTEDGTASVSNVEGVDFVLIESTEDLRKIVEHQTSTSKYRTVMLDTASGLQDLVLKEILGFDELPAQKSWGLASREQWGQCALRTKDLLRSCLDLVRKTGCSTVVVAQEREFNSEGDGDLLMPYVGSALSPSVTGWLNPACDYIVQTFVREAKTVRRTKIGKKTVERKVASGGVEYCLRTAADPVYTTKLRLPKGRVVPDVIVDPTYRKLMDVIQGKG